MRSTHCAESVFFAITALFLGTILASSENSPSQGLSVDGVYITVRTSAGTELLADRITFTIENRNSTARQIDFKIQYSLHWLGGPYDTYHYRKKLAGGQSDTFLLRARGWDFIDGTSHISVQLLQEIPKKREGALSPVESQGYLYKATPRIPETHTALFAETRTSTPQRVRSNFGSSSKSGSIVVIWNTSAVGA